MSEKSKIVAGMTLTRPNMSHVMRKPALCIYTKTEAQISCPVTAQLINICIFQHMAFLVPELKS